MARKDSNSTQILEKWGFIVKDEATLLSVFYQNRRIATFEKGDLQPIKAIVSAISYWRRQLFPNVMQIYVVEYKNPYMWVVLNQNLPVVQVNLSLRRKSYAWEVRSYRTKRLLLRRRYSFDENPIKTLHQIITDVERCLILEETL